MTATDLSGNLLSNAQRLGTAIGGASATTIAAPGDGLTAPSGDSGTASLEGTSFATALVTGGVTLLQEIYQSRFGSLPTVAQIKSWLQEGSTPINDPVTGITLGELNLVKRESHPVSGSGDATQAAGSSGRQGGNHAYAHAHAGSSGRQGGNHAHAGSSGRQGGNHAHAHAGSSGRVDTPGDARVGQCSGLRERSTAQFDGLRARRLRSMKPCSHSFSRR